MLNKLTKFFSSPERDQLADLLKGVAVILMIQVHIMELFAIQSVYDGILGKISLFLGGPPAASIFMAVMGYFIAKSKRSTPKNIIRGIKLFLGGILLNIGLNFSLLLKIYSNEIQLDPFRYIFGADILPLAGLSILFISTIKPIFKQSFFPYFSMSIALSIIASLLPEFPIKQNTFLDYVTSFIYRSTEWSYFPFIPWVSYPLLGFSFSLLREKINIKTLITPRVYIFTLIIFLIFFYASAEYAIDIASNLNLYYSHGLLFYLWTVIFLIGWIFIFALLEKSFGNSILFLYTKWIGKNVTAAYVFQWLLIGNIATRIYKTQDILELVIWFIGITILTTLLLIFWKKFQNST